MRTKNLRARRVALLGVASLALALLVPAAAQAATCSATVGGSGTFVVAGDNVEFNGSPCGSLAGADPLETVDVSGSGTLTFDLSGGDFVNVLDHNVQFRVALTGTSEIVVNGTGGRDEIKLTTKGIDLNGDNDEEVIDTDGNSLTFATGVQTVTVNAGDGSDIVNGRGPGVGDDFPLPLVINGDTGSDDGDGVDVIVGGNGNDVIDGGGGADSIQGGFGDDVMNGGNGNDSFDAERDPAGADLMDGDAGKDRVDYGDREVPLNVSIAAASSGTTDNDGEAGESDDVVEVEVVEGGSNDDTITAAAYSDAALHPRVQLFGNEGVDTLTGGADKDQLFGGDGNDILNGGDGNDRLDGDSGDDQENGNGGNDSFVQGSSSNGADTLNGGEGAADTVKYSGRGTTLTVDLDGNADDGAAGENDNVGADVEKVYGGRAGDNLTTGSGAQTVFGLGGDDVLTGGGGPDQLKGGGGNDVLSGGGGNDVLVGGGGNDDLDGGDGSDLGNGGTGRDTCRNIEKMKSC
ncbi:MAG: calcium-binding protein [Actinomycetota bacterium]